MDRHTENKWFNIIPQHLNIGADERKPVFGGMQTTKAQDQPAHKHRLISAFAIHFLESTISRLVLSEISII